VTTLENHKELFYDAILQSSAEAILIVNQKGIILESNPRATELFEYQYEELKKLCVEDLMPEQFRKMHVKQRDGYSKNPTARSMGENMDLSGRRKSGKEFPIAVSLSHTNYQGTLYVIAMIVDITPQVVAKQKLEKLNLELEDRVDKRTSQLEKVIQELETANNGLKKADEEIREALSKEKELNELKSRFVSMASHEFKTPLSSILTSVGLIDRYKEESQQDKREKHINRIKNNVRNLNSILNDFLSLDKLQEGKVSHNIENVSIKEVFNDLIEEMGSLRKTNQVLSYIHNGEENITIDSTLVKNICTNLLSNAIKYSDEGKEIKIQSELDEKHLIFSIADQGIGIPEEDKKSLFERFYRAKNAINIQGTGLGLNIVKRYLDLLNGEISFESTYMEGTVFTVKIPI